MKAVHTKLLCLGLLVIGVCGCSEIRGPIYNTEMDRSSDSTFLSRPMMKGPVAGYGKVPVAMLLQSLVELQAVRQWPAGPLVGEPITVSHVSRVGDVVRSIEEAERWVFDPDTRCFTRAVATHSLDSPDAFGSPSSGERVPLEARSIVQLSFRFVRLAAGISTDDVSSGITLTSFRAGLPEGVRGQWASTTEHSYYEGVQSTTAYVNSTVNTTLKTVSAGLQLDAMAARLPGGYSRIDGQLEISSFIGGTGSGTGVPDKAEVRVPLQLDGVRHEWHRLVVIRGGDLSGQLAFRNWSGSIGVSGDALEVLVRVD